MSFTITRVELHGAIKSDYENLHGYMAGSGFQRYYDTNGVRYHLPEAEYIRWNGTPKGDLQLAEAAARRTGRDASIIVNQSADFAQSGLRSQRAS